jgi:23S rRNA (cytosine1962-C5)-methyltransferase
LSQSKNVGLFPEQEANWQWLRQTISAQGAPNILNLFAYTGGATLVAAKAGAQVCHVDSAKSTVRWASHNWEISGLGNRPVRWIVDDAMKFLRREIARGVRYDGVILDPPPVGHGKGSIFAFKKHALDLLALTKQALRDKPLLFLFNCYALNYTPAMAKEWVQMVFGRIPMESGELFVNEKKRSKTLSCSVYVRFGS